MISEYNISNIRHAQMIYKHKYNVIFYEIKNIRRKIGKCVYLNLYYKLYQINDIVPNNFICSNYIINKQFYREKISFQKKIFVKSIMKNKQQMYSLKRYQHELMTKFLKLFDELTRIITVKYLNDFSKAIDRENYKLLKKKIQFFKSKGLNTKIFNNDKDIYNGENFQNIMKLNNQITTQTPMNYLSPNHMPTVSIKDNGFENTTKIEFTKKQNMLLNMGPKSTIKHNPSRHDQILYQTETINLTNSIERYLVKPANKDVLLPLNQQLMNAYREENTKHKQSNKREIEENKLNKQIKEIKIKIEENNAILIRADKSNTMILVDKTEYIKGMEKALDKNNFVQVNKDINKTIHNKFRVYLHNLHIEGHIDIKLYNQLYPTNSYTSPIYGRFKNHKKEGGYRPLVATSAAYFSETSKWLYSILFKYSHSKFNIKNAQQLINEINKIKLQPQNRLISFDVESLYGSVNAKVTIEKLIYRYRVDKNKMFKLKLVDLRQLLDYCLKDIPCIFNKKPYTQKQGVATGSALSGLLADIQMDLFETYLTKIKNLFNGPNPKMIFYRRYVDDVVAIIRDEHCAHEILQIFNDFAPNLKFTCEKEVNNSLPYLDINIIRGAENLNFTVYRKPTQNTVKINYNSAYSFTTKNNVLKQEIQRALNTCSNQKYLNIELNNIRLIYLSNAYPLRIINNAIEFYSKKYVNRYNTQCSNWIRPYILPSPSHMIKTPQIVNNSISNYVKNINNNSFLLHTYINNIYKPKIKNSLFTLVDSPLHFHIIFKIFNDFISLHPHLFNIDIYNLILVPPSPLNFQTFFKKVEKLFSTPPPDPSGVVYMYECICKSSYVGNTGRRISIRINEHLKTDKMSQINIHLEKTQHYANEDNFKSLMQIKHKSKRYIAERLAIDHYSPNINVQQVHN